MLLVQTIEVSVAEPVGNRWIPKQYLHHTSNNHLLWLPETYPVVLSGLLFVLLFSGSSCLLHYLFLAACVWA